MKVSLLPANPIQRNNQNPLLPVRHLRANLKKTVNLLRNRLPSLPGILSQQAQADPRARARAQANLRAVHPQAQADLHRRAFPLLKAKQQVRVVPPAPVNLKVKVFLLLQARASLKASAAGRVRAGISVNLRVNQQSPANPYLIASLLQDLQADHPVSLSLKASVLQRALAEN